MKLGYWSSSKHETIERKMYNLKHNIFKIQELIQSNKYLVNRYSKNLIYIGLKNDATQFLINSISKTNQIAS
jgi:hypothetical protein